MEFERVSSKLLTEFITRVGESPIHILNTVKKLEVPVDYFQFYKSISSVYSSKIEGEEIDFDSYFKHKFMQVPFRIDYTRS